MVLRMPIIASYAQRGHDIMERLLSEEIRLRYITVSQSCVPMSVIILIFSSIVLTVSDVSGSKILNMLSLIRSMKKMNGFD